MFHLWTRAARSSEASTVRWLLSVALSMSDALTVDMRLRTVSMRCLDSVLGQTEVRACGLEPAAMLKAGDEPSGSGRSLESSATRQSHWTLFIVLRSISGRTQVHRDTHDSS